MQSKLYSQFTGINQSVDFLDVNPSTFIFCDNVVFNRKVAQGKKRGGTYHWTVTGDIWGIHAYSNETGSTKLPNYDVPIRHRRNGGTSVIEKLDWSDLSWDTITQGTYISGNLGIADTLSAAQIGSLWAVCAGRPAKLTDISAGSLERLGGPAPTAAPTVGDSGTGLTGTYSFVYTFYDSTTGWESSPSAASAPRTIANKQLDLSGLETVVVREGITHKRIYRTIKTGESPFLFDGVVTLATTTYGTVVSDDALGVAAPDFGDHDPPPATSYLVASHDGSLWVSDGSKSLYRSATYFGANKNLEYYSVERRLDFPARVTGLAVTRAGGLQVFLPPGFGIWEVEGSNDTEYRIRRTFDELGTNYKDSISTHDNWIAFWGQDGPTIISASGQVYQLRQMIQDTLTPILIEDYNSSVFVWSVWNDDLEQFVFGFSATDTEAAQWIDADTGVPVVWIDVDTGEIIPWQDNP